jgi:hypothetical protein
MNTALIFIMCVFVVLLYLNADQHSGKENKKMQQWIIPEVNHSTIEKKKKIPLGTNESNITKFLDKLDKEEDDYDAEVLKNSKFEQDTNVHTVSFQVPEGFVAEHYLPPNESLGTETHVRFEPHISERVIPRSQFNINEHVGDRLQKYKANTSMYDGETIGDMVDDMVDDGRIEWTKGINVTGANDLSGLYDISEDPRERSHEGFSTY